MWYIILQEAMDGCERGGDGERLGDLSPSLTTKLSQPPREKDQARTATEKLLAGMYHV